MRCIIPSALFFVILPLGLEADQSLPFHQLQIGDLEADSFEKNGTLISAEESLFFYPELFLKGGQQKESTRPSRRNTRPPFSDRMWLEATVAAMNGDFVGESEESNNTATLSSMLPAEELSLAEYYIALKLQESATEKEKNTAETENEQALLEDDTFREELEKSFGITGWDMSSHANGEVARGANLPSSQTNPYLPKSSTQGNSYTGMEDFLPFTFGEDADTYGNAFNDFAEHKVIVGLGNSASLLTGNSSLDQAAPPSPITREKSAITPLRNENSPSRQPRTTGSEPDYFKGFDQF